MHNKIIYELADANQNMSDVDRLVNLYWALSSVLVAGVPGAVVELGCNAGKTSIFFQMLIDHFDPSRELHVYDSFQGLPARGPHDDYLNKGDCAATVDEFKDSFKQRKLRMPHIHAGWFHETLAASCPDPIAFAYLDGDFYDSILVSLEYAYPRLAEHGLLIVDDYCDLDLSPRAWNGLPGVRRACDDFIADKPEIFSVLVGVGDLSFGMIRKGFDAPR